MSISFVKIIFLDQCHQVKSCLSLYFSVGEAEEDGHSQALRGGGEGGGHHVQPLQGGA